VARFFKTKLKDSELLAGTSEPTLKTSCPIDCFQRAEEPNGVGLGFNIIAGSSGESVVTIPESVSFGEHTENKGTFDCNTIVIVLQSQGSVELCEYCAAKNCDVTICIGGDLGFAII